MASDGRSGSAAAERAPRSAWEKEPFCHRQLQTLAHWIFTAYHDIRVHGAEHVPASGPVIIASNHPTYLDGAFLMVGLHRSVRFMAWEKPFRLPLLGALMRSYGSIPVDMKKPGRGSFEAAVKVLRGGAAFGIFPEGGRTKGLAPMNPFKSGVARLAMITGAPIVPATIVGGRRVWRKGDLLPKPGPITVCFHPPIRVDSSQRLRWRRDKTLEKEIVTDLIETIHRKLLPALRKEERVDRLLAGPPQPPAAAIEGIPLYFLFLSYLMLPFDSWVHHARPAAYWVAGYAAALSVELFLEARGLWVKWLRNLLPWIVLLGMAFQRMNAGHAPIRAASGAALAVFVVWMQIFRFPAYRRLRTPLLIAGYGGWLVDLLRSVP
ncbi:MAG: lysophospholipid acyltransferase family protein [Elusimicrobiota bacterium]